MKPPVLLLLPLHCSCCLCTALALAVAPSMALLVRPLVGSAPVAAAGVSPPATHLLSAGITSLHRAAHLCA